MLLVSQRKSSHSGLNHFKPQSTLGKLPGSWLVDGSDVSSLCCAADSMSAWLSREDSMPGLQRRLAVSIATHFEGSLDTNSAEVLCNLITNYHTGFFGSDFIIISQIVGCFPILIRFISGHHINNQTQAQDFIPC